MQCQLENIDVYYETNGVGRPLIAIHGFTPDHHLMTGCMEPVFAQRDGWQRFFDVDAGEPFEKPALILTGRQDHMVGYYDAWNIYENYPRGSYVVLDRAGHNL
jgi:pimeloyl-ACP methyl ester carboxylesterase